MLAGRAWWAASPQEKSAADTRSADGFRPDNSFERVPISFSGNVSW